MRGGVGGSGGREKEKTSSFLGLMTTFVSIASDKPSRRKIIVTVFVASITITYAAMIRKGENEIEKKNRQRIKYQQF